MKRFLLFLFAIITMSAYPVKDDEIVKFNTKAHDFGDILITDGPVSHTFTFTNISDKPVVIHNVVSSCGCTVPKWTKAPVKPGESGEIEVTFKNDQGPYHFYKTLTVYISGLERPVSLKITGDVHQKEMSIDELYSEQKIGVVGFRQKNYSAGYINQGASESDKIEIANLSDKEITITQVSDSPALSFSVKPNPVPAHSTATISWKIDTKKGEQQWGKTFYPIKLAVNGKPQKGEVTIMASIQDNFDNYTRKMLDNAPVPYLEKTFYEFGEVESGKVMECSYNVKTRGKNDLVIHKIEVERAGVEVITKMPVTVSPSGQGVVKLKLDTSKMRGEVVNVLTLITNSPNKPMVNFFVNGYVNK